MEEKHNYSINLNVKYGPLKLMDIPSLAASVKEEWYNQSLCQINDCVVRVGVFKKGEFHWHKHDKEDEFFFTLSGEFIIDLENERIVLRPNQGFAVPRGVLHKTSVTKPTTILMMEAATVQPTGD